MNPPTRTVEPYERATPWSTEDSALAAANTSPWDLSPTAYGADDHLQDTTRGWKTPAWLAAIVGCIAVVRLISHLAGAGSSSDAGWGVHVCEIYNYGSHAQCDHDNAYITLGGGSSGPRLSFSGVNGANFSSAPVTFTIKVQNSSQHVVAQGTATTDVSTTDNVGSVGLDSMLLAAGIDPEPLGDYHIAVRQGATDLGSASFSVTGISSYSGGDGSSTFDDGSLDTGDTSNLYNELFGTPDVHQH